MDPVWRRWSEDTFGKPYDVWHDGPDFTAMLAAARADAGQVARMLRIGLAAQDPLAARGLAELAAIGLAPADAVDVLHDALATAGGDFLTQVALALFALTGNVSWAGRIVGVLEHDEHWGRRLDAAIALARFPPEPPLIDALGRAVATDPDYLVRYHAANTLLRYAGSDEQISDRREVFDHLRGDDPEGWRFASVVLTSG